MAADDSRPEAEKRPHRRDFVRSLGLAGAAGLVSGGRSSAQEPDEEKPAPERSEADARMDLVLARYGKHLDDDARLSVRRDVEAVVRRGERLRAFELSNGDGPMPVFSPYRAPVMED
jgi:hypothetical protein